MPKRHLVPLAVLSVATSLAVGFAGCVGDEPGTTPSGTTDAGGSDTSAPADAGGGDAADGASTDAAPTTCRWDQPFSPPALVSALNSALVDTAARLSTDELSVYFARPASDAGLNADLFFASRATRTAPFGTPVELTALSTPSVDGFPTLSSDGLTLVFNSDRGGNFDLYVSTRASVLASFDTASALATVDSPQSDVHPYLSFDGSELLFASNRAGTDDLYRAVKTAGGFGVPAPIAELNTPNVEFAPVLSADKLFIYFSSNREGATNIFVAHRSTTSDGFGAATKVAELNAAGVDSVPSWVSPDGCRLYLWRSTTGLLEGDIYIAERSPQ